MIWFNKRIPFLNVILLSRQSSEGCVCWWVPPDGEKTTKNFDGCKTIAVHVPRTQNIISFCQLAAQSTKGPLEQEHPFSPAKNPHLFLPPFAPIGLGPGSVYAALRCCCCCSQCRCHASLPPLPPKYFTVFVLDERTGEGTCHNLLSRTGTTHLHQATAFSSSNWTPGGGGFLLLL